MPYFDPDAGASVKAAVDAAVLEWPSVTTKTMFGCPSYQAAGTLFAVVVTDGVALTRLPEDQRDRIADRFETAPFQAGGRTITKWVQASVDDADDVAALVPFLEASYEAALAEESG